MSSWEFKKNLGQMRKWNNIFLSITCLWALMILSGPLILETGETGDLSGSVGLYDNKEIIIADIDTEEDHLFRRNWGLFRDRRTDLYNEILTLDGKVKD